MTARILVVEDHQANRDLMRYVLHSFGYEVDEAVDGEEGLAMMLTGTPNLVICDMQLPGMDGFEVIAKYRAALGKACVPVLAVSAMAMVGDRDRILGAGFDGYVAKPIDPLTFIDRIEAYLPEHMRSTDRPVPAGADEPDETPREARRHRTILVVDDIADNRQLLRSVLEPSGFTVLMASSGNEALAMLTEVSPDVIVSDLHLEGEPDFQFIRRVKADSRLAGVPFIFLSSTSRTHTLAAEGRKLGAVRFLFRPLHPEALLSEIERFVRKPGAH